MEDGGWAARESVRARMGPSAVMSTALASAHLVGQVPTAPNEPVPMDTLARIVHNLVIVM